MIYLVLSILSSAFMMLLFKWFPRYKVDTFQAIVVNYQVCVLTGLLLTPPPADKLSIYNLTEQSWLLPAIILGASFVSCFPWIGRSVQKHGATVTTVAGRTSMIMPVSVAIYLYGDSLSLGKFLGLILALAAILLTSIHPNPTDTRRKDELSIGKRFTLPILPLMVFAMNGIIEIMFNYSQRYFVKEGQYEFFTIALFVAAAIIGMLSMLYTIFVSRTRKWAKQNLWAGIILGIPNYFSAYFLLLALEKSHLESSSVIPLNNIGIVILTCMGALLLFNEKLTRLSGIGLILAVVAICCISGCMKLGA